MTFATLRINPETMRIVLRKSPYGKVFEAYLIDNGKKQSSSQSGVARYYCLGKTEKNALKNLIVDIYSDLDFKECENADLKKLVAKLSEKTSKSKKKKGRKNTK
jgi:hypothetical protein